MTIAISAMSFVTSCDKAAEVGPNTLSEAEKADGWVLLFDGKTSEGWRGYKKDHFPAAWKIDDGTIHMLGSGRGEAGDADGGDIIFDKVFQNFTLSLEWKISEGGTSFLTRSFRILL